MRKEHDKKIFICILAVMLAALIIVCWEPAGTNQPAQSAGTAENSLINDTLYLEVSDYANLYIGGQGILEAADLKTLLSEQHLLTSDVSNVIIGDEITEIGYNCFNNYTYLESLKLGNQTTKIGNGAIKRCASLKYLYLPDTVERIGQDFLLSCSPSLLIVTNGTADAVQELCGTDTLKIIEACESYEDFLYDVEEITAISTFGPEQLFTSGSRNVEDDQLILEPGNSIYGPYTDLPKGSYVVEIYGYGFENLDDSLLLINYSSVQTDTVEVEETTIWPDVITHRITVKDYIKQLEFPVLNHTETEIYIDEIIINFDYLALETTEFIENWW